VEYSCDYEAVIKTRGGAEKTQKSLALPVQNVGCLDHGIQA
jgi:hypothetical protein